MAFIEVKNISKSFGKTKVLKGVSFSLEKGEVLAIIGSSGGGKTTLLRCLNFLEIPNSGTISVNGKLLIDGENKELCEEKNIRKNRLHFGLVFQQFNLFPQYNVLDNLTLAPMLSMKKAVKDRAERKIKKQEIVENAYKLLERVGLTEKAKAYPCELSGGQQQRVAIARALALSPDIICFDEPTSALDPELTGEVQRVISDLSKVDETMIIVTHEMEFARSVADKVIFIDEGVIAEMGTPQEVFDNPQSERLKSFLHRSNF